MKYLIVEAESAAELQAKVQQHIQQGWEPLGGLSVSVSQHTGSWWYYQAMVLRENA